MVETMKNRFNQGMLDFARNFTLGLVIARGNVEVRGRLERTSSWHTDHRSGTLGKVFQNGFFVAGNRGSSDSRQTHHFTTNLVKIGNTTAANVEIPSSALFDAIPENSKVACVFTGDLRQLLAVKNFSNGIELAFPPNLQFQFIAMLVFGGIAGVTALTIFSGGIGPVSLIFLTIGLLGFRVFQVALAKSRENYQRALSEMQRVF